MPNQKLISSAGKRGENVRSDCYFEIELKSKGGIKLNTKSKVDSMYGKSNREFILKLCKFFSIKNAEIIFEDSGALPFTISARFESAVKRFNHEISDEFLPEFNPKNLYPTKKDRLR
ncbi:MAG: citrate lyase ACP, partial [Ignavibacteria bacterium]|nr:citrate lyase ACP [Ignavibacteria bacterium]